MHPRTRSAWLRAGFRLLSLATIFALAPLSKAQGLTSSDLTRFRFVGDAVLSPDSHRIAYTVILYDRPGRPSPQLWIMDLATQKPIRHRRRKRCGGQSALVTRWEMAGVSGKRGREAWVAAGARRRLRCHGACQQRAAQTARLPGAGQDLRGRPTANRLLLFLRRRTKELPRPAAIPWSSRATCISPTPAKA